MTTTRSGVQLDVHLHGVECCFSYCQHTSAILTDLATGRKFDIEYPNAPYVVYPSGTETPLEKSIKGNCIRTATIYSSKDFDAIVTAIKTGKYGNPIDYDFCSNNCADAVRKVIDDICPERAGVDAFCCTYKIACCWAFLGSLGLKCFPSICCTTPSDTFDLAMILSCTSYGTPPVVRAEIAHQAAPAPAEESKVESKSDSLSAPLLSRADDVSVSVVTSGTGPALYASPSIAPKAVSREIASDSANQQPTQYSVVPA